MDETPSSKVDNRATRRNSAKLSNFSPVEKLSVEHEVSGFDCGQNSLNVFLRRHALPNQLLGSSTTFVMCLDKTKAVAGYYSLAASSIDRAAAPEDVSQYLPPYSIPVILLARLAVDRQYQGQKLGQRLLVDAMQRSANAANHIGARALMVHALDREARHYYEMWGFQPAPEHELLLFLRMDAIRESLAFEVPSSSVERRS